MKELKKKYAIIFCLVIVVIGGFLIKEIKDNEELSTKNYFMQQSFDRLFEGYLKGVVIGWNETNMEPAELRVARRDDYNNVKNALYIMQYTSYNEDQDYYGVLVKCSKYLKYLSENETYIYDTKSLLEYYSQMTYSENSTDHKRKIKDCEKYIDKLLAEIE